MATGDYWCIVEWFDNNPRNSAVLSCNVESPGSRNPGPVFPVDCFEGPFTGGFTDIRVNLIIRTKFVESETSRIAGKLITKCIVLHETFMHSNVPEYVT